MDGTLADPLWSRATPIGKFLQREPYEGQTPTEKTEVRILYTKREVLFGITCFGANPKRIISTELCRDVSQELDDNFEIVIDSAHDRRNAYVFQINPLGTQRDALITEEQVTDSGLGDGDPGWDGVWTSEARISASGWTATIAIPFATLNFMQSRDVIGASTSSDSSDGRTKKTCSRVGGVSTVLLGLAKLANCEAFRILAVDAYSSSSHMR